jgi:hypothetical protein
VSHPLVLLHKDARKWNSVNNCILIKRTVLLHKPSYIYQAYIKLP